MSMGQDELSNAPNFCKKSRRSYKKVLEITCRVITNCEKQINLYADPFGSELAKLARWVNEAMRKTHLVGRQLIHSNSPWVVTYFLESDE